MKLKILTNEEFRIFEKDLGARTQYYGTYYGRVHIEGIKSVSILDEEIITCPKLIERALEKHSEREKQIDAFCGLQSPTPIKEKKKWF